MLITKPNRDADFCCLASACSDNCCAGWEIVVDDQSACRFSRMEGELGQRVRAALYRTDGEYRLARHDSHCVLLNGQNLCDLYAACGEQALCDTCRLHPRFVAEYGARREIMPGLSCLAWIRTYLLDEGKVTLVSEETDEPITSYTDIDAGLFFRLHKARAQALELLQQRSLPLPERMRRVLTLAAELDGVQEEVCTQSRVTDAYLGKLRTLEILTPQWRARLNEPGGGVLKQSEMEPLLEKVLVYDVFRFFLQGVYSGRVLPWVKYALFHALVLCRLGSGCSNRTEFAEVIRLFSKEIEHNAENVEALYRVFCRRSGRYGAAGVEKALAETMEG